MRSAPRSALVCVLTAVAAALATPAAAGAAPGLERNIENAFGVSTGPDGAIVMQRARETGAKRIRVQLNWASIAPDKPPSDADAQNPAWSGYRWTGIDNVIRAHAAAGLSTMPYFFAAPAWAEGANRPAISDDAPRGSWDPSPSDLRNFAIAAAKRYSGAFVDPTNTAPGPLPAISAWQAWNEPNLALDISPQWRDGKPASPEIYRGVLNAVYDGVKSVSSRNLVVTAGTAPYGDLQPGGRRVPPARFWRDLVCVTGRKTLRATTCPTKARFDVVAHHPYPVGPPSLHARNADDVAVSDLDRITRPVAVAVKAKTVVPARSKPFWVTEMQLDSSPPDPGGEPSMRHAKLLEEIFYRLWRQGVDAVSWFQIRDQPEGAGWDQTYQGGLYLNGATVAQDTPKLALTAYRFPFVAFRSTSTTRVWGLTPSGRAAPVKIQRRAGSSWKTVKTLRAGGNGVYTGSVKAALGASLRAVTGTETSLTWKVLRADRSA